MKYIILILAASLYSVDYESQIQPIFDNNCGNCHLGNSSGGLNLSNYENTMSSGTVVPGDYLSSSLYDRITRDNSASGDMPPGNSELSQSEIDLIAQWIEEGALPEESNDLEGCTDPNAITCDELLNTPICEDFNNAQDCLSVIDCLWDSFGESCSGGFTLYFPYCDTCSDDDPCENYYDENATVDNNSCMYSDVPTYDEFTIEYFDVSIDFNSGYSLDWSAFIPPIPVDQYVLQRCLDPDGDSNGDGYLEYENCVMVIPPNSFYLETSYIDEYEEEIPSIKYTLYVDYPNNNYWGSAHGYYYYEDNVDQCTLGDVSGDGIINVIDIVTLVNYILGGSLTDEGLCASDLNEDGLINVIDIVTLVNIILS